MASNRKSIPRKKTRCIDKRVKLGIWQNGRHNIYPALNLSKFFEGTIAASRSGPLPYFFDYPKPLTNECIPMKKQWKDIGTDIVERSLGYFKELNHMKERLMCNKQLCRMWNIRLKQRKLTTSGEGPFNIYPTELLDYAKQLELNPEPEFSGGYNWYLTGGSLSVIPHNNKIYVVRPWEESLNHLDITPIHKKGNHLVTKKTSRIDLSSGGPIHEICTRSHEEELLIITRTKNNIGFLRQGNEIGLNYFNSKVPYVSCDLSSELHLATTNTDKQMRIYDLNTSKTLNKFDLEYVRSLIPDNWSSIKSFHIPNCYLYTDRRNIRPIDTRTNVIGTHFTMTDYGEICDYISCVTPSQRFENLIYVGTSHRLFAIDLRNFSGVIDQHNVVLSWTHLMNLPPSMIRTTVMNEGEMILISSNLPGDMRVLFTEHGTEYKNMYLPVRPPSATDSLQVVKDNFVCLNPVSSVNRRVRICLTGMDFMTTISGKTSIISQNSICDVFKQNITTEKEDDVGDVCTKMKSWMEYVDEVEEEVPETKEFGATAVIYKKDLVRVFKSTRLSRPNELEEELEAAKPKQRPRWQRSIAELAKYKDALVESIMEVWDFPKEDNENFTLDQTKPEPLSEKIQSWFEKSQFENNNSEEIEDNLSDATKTEAAPTGSQKNLLDETKDTSYMDFAGDFNIFQASTQQEHVDKEPKLVVQNTSLTEKEFIPNTPAIKSATKTKRKRHVMGF